jgi:serine/threonine-protein kinase
MPELIAAILAATPPPIRDSRPDLPPELAAVIERCLEKEPARRFSDVADLARALAPFGPARSAISVERITHVLHGQGSPVASGAAGAELSGGVTGPVAATARFPAMGGVTGGVMTTGSGPRGTEMGELPAAPRSKALVGIVAGGVAVGVTVGVAFMLWPSEPPATVSHHLLPPSPSAPPVAAADPSPPPPEASTQPVSPPVASAAPASPPPKPASPSVKATPHPSSGGTKAAASAAPPPKPQTVDCTVPYTIDTRGHHVPKPECM